MSDIRVICAIGQSGQLGLNGGMPWEGSSERVYIEDVERFFDVTRGHVLICGPKTVSSFPDFAHEDRTIVTIRSDEKPEDVLARYSDRVVFVGGGPAVWDVYAKYVRHWDINRLPYDGEADTWFDPAWLLAGGRQNRG